MTAQLQRVPLVQKHMYLFLLADQAEFFIVPPIALPDRIEAVCSRSVLTVSQGGCLDSHVF